MTPLCKICQKNETENPEDDICFNCFKRDLMIFLAKEDIQNKISFPKQMKRFTYYFLFYAIPFIFIGHKFGLTIEIICMLMCIWSLMVAPIIDWLMIKF